MNSLVTGGMFQDFIPNGQGGGSVLIKAQFTVSKVNNVVTALSTSESDNTIDTYNWSIFLDGTLLGNSASNSVTFTLSNPGTYLITLLVTDVLGNHDSISSTVVYEINEVIGQAMSGISGGGVIPHSFPVIELKKIEEEDVEVEVIFLGQ